MCDVVFMFMGRSVEEVLPLTVRHANTMHHMSTHLVTVCSDPAVNRGYPGNQVVGGVRHWFHQYLLEGKNAHGEAFFRNDSNIKTERLRGTKRQKKKKPFGVRTVQSESDSAKTCLHLLSRTLFIWYLVNTSMAESLAVPQHTTHHFISPHHRWGTDA